MISEGACDLRDWSNDAEIQLRITEDKLHFKIYYNRNSYFKF